MIDMAHGARLHRDRAAARTPPTTPTDYLERGRRLRADRRRRGDAGRAARPPRPAAAARPARASPAWPSATRRASVIAPAAAPDIKRPRRAALPGLGPGRRRALPRDLARAPRLLLDEHGHHARLPVPLQLVRQADLGPALQRPQRRRTWSPRWPGCKRALPARPHLVRRRHLRPQARLAAARSPTALDEREAAHRRSSASAAPTCSCASGDDRGAGAGRRADRLDRRRVGLAEDPRRDGEGHAGRADLRGGAAAAARPASRSAFFLQFGYPGETRDDIELDAADGARLLPGRHRHVGLVPAARHAFFTAVQHELGDKQNWLDSDDLAMLYRRPVHAPLLPPAAPRRCTASSVRGAPGRSRAPCCVRHPRTLAAASPAASRARCLYSLRLPLLRAPRRWRACRSRAAVAAGIGAHDRPGLRPRRRRTIVMDLLLTHGYFLSMMPHELAVMKPYPPLGLLYISSHLKAQRRRRRRVRHHVSSPPTRSRSVSMRATAAGRRHLQQPDDASATRCAMIAIAQQRGRVVVIGGPDPANYAERVPRAAAPTSSSSAKAS